MLIRDVRAPNGDGGLEISLHPEVTVMTGLGPDGQVAIADILAAVIYGRTEGLAGSVELDGAALALSEWAAAVGEDLDHFDVFLRPSDLPSAASPGSRAVDPAMSAALGMRLEQAQAAVEDARGRLAAASDRRAVAVAGRVAAERVIEGAEAAMAASRTAGEETDQDGHADLVELHDKAALTLAEAEVAERSAQAA